MPYLLIVLLLAGCTSVQPATATNPADILKSTVKIETHFMTGNASIGSGTVVGVEETPAGFEYTILTAEHVLKPSPIHLVIGLSVITNDRDVTGQTRSVVKTWLMSDAYTVLSVNGSDLALIKFWSPQQLPVSVAKQDAISPILETSRIYAAGNSYGHGPFLYEGRVGSLVTTQDYPIKPLYTASIQWDAGASGGGVYNSSLELIGVVIAELGDLGFFLPLNAEANHGGNVVPIRDLIEGMRLINVPMPKHVPYVEGSAELKLMGGKR